MRFSILNQLRAARPYNVASAVSRDADDLMNIYGTGAFERASDLSWKEDSGLVRSPHPGHWWNVRREIGRRMGRADQIPGVEIAA